MKKIIFSLAVFLLFFSLPLITFSQVNFVNQKASDINNKFNVQSGNDEARPYLELNYGFTSFPNSKGLSADFNKNGIAGVEFGLQGLSRYFTIQYGMYYEISSNKIFSINKESDKIQSDLTNFGLTPPKIFYNVGENNFYLYHSLPFDVSWSKIHINNYPSLISSEDIDNAEKYNNIFRFSNSRDFGFRFSAKNRFFLDFGYETRVIYPRYIFLQHSVSNLTEMAFCTLPVSILGSSFVLSDLFNSKDFSISGEVTAWIVESAIEFLFQQLRKDNMNWPVSSVKPFYTGSFKFGIGFAL